MLPGNRRPEASLTRTLAHISDLHLGRDSTTDAAAQFLVEALLAARVDDVLLTGDVTHRGRRSELRLFERTFAPLLEQGRLAVVPGNHDRMGDDVAGEVAPGGRVSVLRRPGLHVVRLDSTAPHNRSLIDGHGELTPRDVAAVEAALAEAPSGAMPVLMLHHHLLPLPEDDLAEKLASLLGWPCAGELGLGRELLGRILGVCRLVLHGHRHVPSEHRLSAPGVPDLRLANAGSTTALGRSRVFCHAGGEVLWEGWFSTGPLPARAWTEALPRRGAVREAAAA
jgi:3',5'-cyclic-AMP phosphodiesterase